MGNTASTITSTSNNSSNGNNGSSPVSHSSVSGHNQPTTNANNTDATPASPRSISFPSHTTPPKVSEAQTSAFQSTLASDPAVFNSSIINGHHGMGEGLKRESTKYTNQIHTPTGSLFTSSPLRSSPTPSQSAHRHRAVHRIPRSRLGLIPTFKYQPVSKKGNSIPSHGSVRIPPADKITPASPLSVFRSSHQEEPIYSPSEVIDVLKRKTRDKRKYEDNYTADTGAGDLHLTGSHTDSNAESKRRRYNSGLPASQRATSTETAEEFVHPSPKPADDSQSNSHIANTTLINSSLRNSDVPHGQSSIPAVASRTMSPKRDGHLRTAIASSYSSSTQRRKRSYYDDTEEPLYKRSINLSYLNSSRDSSRRGTPVPIAPGPDCSDNESETGSRISVTPLPSLKNSPRASPYPHINFKNEYGGRSYSPAPPPAKATLVPKLETNSVKEPLSGFVATLQDRAYDDDMDERRARLLMGIDEQTTPTTTTATSTSISSIVAPDNKVVMPIVKPTISIPAAVKPTTESQTTSGIVANSITTVSSTAAPVVLGEALKSTATPVMLGETFKPTPSLSSSSTSGTLATAVESTAPTVVTTSSAKVNQPTVSFTLPGSLTAGPSTTPTSTLATSTTTQAIGTPNTAATSAITGGNAGATPILFGSQAAVTSSASGTSSASLTGIKESFGFATVTTSAETSTTAALPVFGFGASLVSASDPPTTSSVIAPAPTSASFSFGGEVSSSKPAATGFSFGGPQAPALSSNFTFGPTSKPSTSAASAVTTGTQAKPVTNGTPPAVFSFGSSALTNGVTVSSTASLTSAPSLFTGFQSSSTSSAPSLAFGSTANTSSVAPTANFAFGSTSSTSVSNEASVAPPTFSGFKFGAAQSTTTTSSAQSSTTPAFTFGATKSSAPSASPFSFGGAQATSSSTGSTATTSSGSLFAFGQQQPSSATAAPASAAGAASSGSIFGNTLDKPAATSGFSFGAGSTASPFAAPPSYGSSIFGNQSSTTTTSATSTAASATTVTSASSMFGAAAGSAPAPSIFGSSQPATSAGTGVFGATAIPTFGASNSVKPASVGFNFGGASATAFGQSAAPTSAPAFGQPTSTPATAFGQPTSTPATAFGQPTSTPATAFGQPTSNPPSFNFGGSSSNVPAFGAGSTGGSQGIFGSSASAPVFGSGNSQNKLIFGSSNSASSTPVFGSSTAQPSPFGAAAQPNVNPFGASQQSTNQAKPAFNFGSTTIPPTFGASTAVPQFGAGATPGVTGGASGAGMFSMGTSKAAPRRRTRK